jgi:hypothetical protein
MNAHPQPARGRRTGASGRLALFGILAIAGLGIGGCSAAASAIPSAVSSALTNATIPPLPTGGSPLAACVDSATYAVIQQLKAPGADVAGILTANKTVLTTGLQQMHPADAATNAWRDALVAALNSGDMAGAATQVALLTNSQVGLTSC